MTYYTSEERARMAAAAAEYDRLVAAWTRRERVARLAIVACGVFTGLLFFYGVTQ